jgi:Flp pilus assembly protein TadD
LKASATPGLGPLGEQAGNLLKSLPPVQQDSDAAVMAALGDINLSKGDPASALPFFRRASELEPSSGEYAMFFGIALKQMDPVGAARELRRAIELDASLERAYLELSALYEREGKASDAVDVLNGYLKWNPQSILGRLTKEGLTKTK